MATGAPQRAALLAVKLRALVRDHTGEEGRPRPLPGGAALDVSGERWVLVDDELRRALGGAVAAAGRESTRLHLVVDAPAKRPDHDPYSARDRLPGLSAGDLARRAAFFAHPPVQVWEADGRTLRPVEPTDRPQPSAVPADVAAFADVVTAAGADPVVEHGVLIAEVEGLEVGRAYADHEGHARLHVGVGRHDQDAFALMHGDAATVEALSAVVDRVRRHRSPGAEPHPLGRLAAERRLRRRLVSRPGLVDADHLAPVPPVLPQPNLLHPFPAAAAGIDGAGHEVVCVCSVGGDLDVVPTAADLRAAHGNPRTLVVVPAGGDLAVIRAVAAAVSEPLELVTVEPESAPGA